MQIWCTAILYLSTCVFFAFSFVYNTNMLIYSLGLRFGAVNNSVPASWSHQKQATQSLAVTVAFTVNVSVLVYPNAISTFMVFGDNVCIRYSSATASCGGAHVYSGQAIAAYVSLALHSLGQRLVRSLRCSLYRL